VRSGRVLAHPTATCHNAPAPERHDRIQYSKNTERHSAWPVLSPHTEKENAMSKFSRRSLVAGAATLPALSFPVAATASATAVSSPSVAEAIDPKGDAAALARCEQIVDVLRSSFVREGWSLDEAGAESALSYFKNPVVTGPGEDDDYAFWAARDFLIDHGQSFDWVFDGSPNTMICQLAAQSPRAAATAAADPVFAAIEAHRKAVALVSEASEAPCKMSGGPGTAKVCVGYRRDLKFIENRKDEQGRLITIWDRSDEMKPVYAYDTGDIERNVPEEIKDDDAQRAAWIKSKLAEFRKEQRRLERNFARTKLGKLQAIQYAAMDRAAEAGIALAETRPTTIGGAIALLSYFAEVEGLGDDSSFPQLEDDPISARVARTVAAALGDHLPLAT
jgi:hypothetical protein